MTCSLGCKRLKPADTGRKVGRVKRSKLPFSFVLDELWPVRPRITTAFGFTYVYLDDVLLCGLRDSVKQPSCNGMWLFTTTEYADNLAKEFPGLSRRNIWRSGSNAWIILASRLQDFEEYAFKACELILNGDRRIGRLSRRRNVRSHRATVSGSPL